MKDALFFLIGLTVFAVALFFPIMLGMYTVHWYAVTHWTETNIISVQVDGHEVYHGKSAYTQIESRGSATHVVIFSRRWPIDVQECEYVSHNVVVTPLSEKGTSK